MSNYKFTADYKGIGELLKSKEMTKILNEYADGVLNRLPSGYGKTSGETSQRAKVTVGTRSIAAELDNKHNNTLLKALK